MRTLAIRWARTLFLSAKLQHSPVECDDTATFKGYLRAWMRETASEGSGNHRIKYQYSDGGTQRGTGMVNTILNGSGNYQTFQGGGNDDYRAQEFPNGSATTAATQTFEITKF